MYAVGHVPPREISEAYGQVMTNTKKWRALGSMSSPLVMYVNYVHKLLCVRNAVAVGCGQFLPVGG